MDWISFWTFTFKKVYFLWDFYSRARITWDVSSGQAALGEVKKLHTHGLREWVCFFFFKSQPSSCWHSIHQHNSSACPSWPAGKKLPGAGITKGRGMLCCLGHAIKQKRCGTCAAFNTTSTTEVQLQEQNSLARSLHAWSWVTTTFVHLDTKALQGDVMPEIPLPPATTLEKPWVPDLETWILAPTSPRCTPCLVLLSWWGSAIWFSLDCYYWSVSLRF